ncbi:P-loop containing nucleoside triphosphate hydrolase protein [Mycena maculata]|uniref:P-loop containing nucleoside triphosphate hydrolase protein n=1 Tax=Mycena maculata TaxID=230809 RepID=A0AAD7NST1_9AGAR|nr:P-loop containing nucleoside triphosphate hydrolase protein [Mycena maculata]
MRLAACVPVIPAHLVSSLEQCGIRTEADLLFSGSTYDIFRRLPPGTTTLRELAEFTAVVAKLASVPGTSVADLMGAYTESDDDNEFLSGLPQLDELLKVATPRRLIEISGDKGSGKTQLLLHLVLQHLVQRPQSGVLWIDTTGDFSAVRAGEILELFGIPDASTALERLQVSLAFEVDTVHEVLEDLRVSLTNPPPEVQIRGIVVDTVTSLFSPILSPVSSQGHAIMTGFMRQLRAFAQTFSITVFVRRVDPLMFHYRSAAQQVVNNSAAFTPFVPGSTSNNPNIRKPALGPSFTFLTDATLWVVLCRDDSDPHKTDGGGNESTKHVAQLYRSKVTTSKVLCSFKIQQGILLVCEEA